MRPIAGHIFVRSVPVFIDIIGLIVIDLFVMGIRKGSRADKKNSPKLYRIERCIDS
ncbi:MAG: hypothetical protein ACLUOS_16930 [Odoribacter splanchnicus]